MMFEPVQNKKVYQQVVDQIQAMILDGKLKRGDRLPPEREMAELFHVSRTSIREAIRSLDILGLVESRQGGGNYIRNDFSGNVLEPLSILFKLNEGSFQDILETRKILESESAALAAKRIDPRQRIELSRIMSELEKTDDEEERVALDAEFHLKIVEASGNYLVGTLYRAVSSIMKNFIFDASKLFIAKEKMGELLDHHRAIHAAVVSGDANAASEAVRKHFDFIIEILSQ